MIRLYTLSFIFILICSCGQDSDIFIEQSNQKYIDQLFEELEVPGQTFTYYGDNTSVNFITEEQIGITIQLDGIKDAEGNQYMGQQTLTVQILDSARELFHNQLSSEVNGYLFSPVVTLNYTITDDQGRQLSVSPNAVKCYVPGEFDDSAVVNIYSKKQSDIWTDASGRSGLRIGEFEIYNSEATVWSGFGYTFDAMPEMWYTVTAENSLPNVKSQQLCIESAYDYTDTRVYLVNTVNNSAVQVSYSTIMEQFCDDWKSGLDHTDYHLYLISAYNEQEYGLVNLEINNLGEDNELNLPTNGKILDKLEMLQLLRE